jgi:hypothetical protein
MNRDFADQILKPHSFSSFLNEEIKQIKKEEENQGLSLVCAATVFVSESSWITHLRNHKYSLYHSATSSQNLLSYVAISFDDVQLQVF